jgi:Enoyl-(Acyl carrier protein) reductase
VDEGAAINRQGNAGNEIRLIGRQKQRGVCDVPRRAHLVAQRDPSIAGGRNLSSAFAGHAGARVSTSNGRATILRFAEEGAKVLAVDNNLSSAEVAIARQAGGECVAFEADVAVEATLAAMVEAARRRWGRIDLLHYNVGVSIAGGDAPLDEITEPAFDRITTINLRGAIMSCR